mmetsp:Transcript_244/g.670  ORF Transcript_244/g.670 Transcript_244/m.670 type:complete len:378 (+) Transcript_244:134-1267(+)
MVSPISYGSCASQTSFAMKESLLSMDQLETMLNVERKYRVPRILCQAAPEINDSHPYSEWRRKICQWSFKVIDHYKFDREVVSRAMNVLDRYLFMKINFQRDKTDNSPDDASIETVDSRTYQLAAMTSLYLAIKLSCNDEREYLSSRKLSLNSFVELSRGQFYSDEITEMERVILQDLQWEVFPPTPMTSVYYLLCMMPSHETLPYTCHKSYNLVLRVLHQLARYLTELSVCHAGICTAYTSSQVAYASILLSMELLTPIALPIYARDKFNEVVALTSIRSGGTSLSSQDKNIKYLQDLLRESFEPEILVEDCEYAEIGHPISMAKVFGLLDTSHIVSAHHTIATNSASPSYCAPLSAPFDKEPDLRDSPICVNRHY